MTNDAAVPRDAAVTRDAVRRVNDAADHARTELRRLCRDASGRAPGDQDALFGAVVAYIKAIALLIEELPPQVTDAAPWIAWREIARLPEILDDPAFRPDPNVLRLTVQDQLWALSRLPSRPQLADPELGYA